MTSRIETSFTEERPRLTTNQKALKINLDPLRYGTFAEIGAGQEVARWFFKVGAAAGTISKSISAYDMAVSDAIYGLCKRYVSRERLQSSDQRIALEPGAIRILQPFGSLDDLLRVGRRHQHLREQLVGVERNRRDRLVDLLARVVRRRRIGRIGLLDGRRGLAARRRRLSRRERGRDQEEWQDLCDDPQPK